MAKKMIEVDERTYARLVEQAARRDLSVDRYIAQLVGVMPKLTSAEKEARARQTEDYLREHFGFDPTPEERAALEARHAAIMADLDAQGARRASA